MTDSAWIPMAAAFALDLAAGDPDFYVHPVRLMGRGIDTWEPFFRRLPIDEVLSGTIFALSGIFCAWLVSWLVIMAAGFLGTPWAIAAKTAVIYFAIAPRALMDAAMNVYTPLSNGDICAARKAVSMIVGRETANLDKAGVSRAAVESVAENLSDGVIAPLFFAFLCGAPAAMAYRAANTFDSMIGYKNEKYYKFGKGAAKIDDLLNWAPARLSAVFTALAAHMLARRGKQVLKTVLADARNHASPNSGYPEAAFAGALGVRLGGPCIYNGKKIDAPVIGTSFSAEPGPYHIKLACGLMLMASLFALACFCTILF